MYRWVEHGRSRELEIDSDSERDVFVDAVDAVCELMCVADEDRR